MSTESAEPRTQRELYIARHAYMCGLAHPMQFVGVEPRNSFAATAAASERCPMSHLIDSGDDSGGWDDPVPVRVEEGVLIYPGEMTSEFCAWCGCEVETYYDTAWQMVRCPEGHCIRDISTTHSNSEPRGTDG